MPYVQAEIPFAAGSHASYTGAVSVVETWTARQSAYLQLLHQAGPLTDHEAAALLKCGLSSINSVRNACERAGVQFSIDGYDSHTFTDLTGKQRTTKRSRWQLATAK